MINRSVRVKTVLKLWGILLAGCLTITGCSFIPTSGPVEQINQNDISFTSDLVDIKAIPPKDGASPENIIAGYLSAMAADDSGYAIAAQYLTPKASQSWNPHAKVTIYQAKGDPFLVDSPVVTLQSSAVGVIDSFGHYYSDFDDKKEYRFQLEEVNGQWRIANPPEGILISEYLFRRIYLPISIYYLSKDYRSVVPDLIYLNHNEADVTTVAKAVIAPPSDWIAPAVNTSFEDYKKFKLSSVSVSDVGVATISLTYSGIVIPGKKLDYMGIQFGYSLARFSEISAVKVLINGAAYPLPNADAGGVLELKSIREYDLLNDEDEEEKIYAVNNGKLSSIKVDADSSPTENNGIFGTGDLLKEISYLEVSDSTNSAYVVNEARNQIIKAELSPEPTQQRKQPKSVISGVEKLTKPQVIDQKEVWVIGHKDNVPILYLILPNSIVKPIPLTQLAGSTVEYFSLSPDKTRLAVVSNKAANYTLGILRVRNDDSGYLILDSYKKLKVRSTNGELDRYSGVGWLSSTRIGVLGEVSSQSTPAQVYQTTMDGAFTKLIGPTATISPTQIAIKPKGSGVSVVLLDSAGNVWKYVGSSRWDIILSDVSRVAFG